MSGSIESLDQDGISNKPSFMDIQQSLSLPQHQPYSSFRSSYTSTATPAHEAFAQVQSSRSLSGYPFSSMNNTPLHSAYSHHTGHSYLGSCGPCPPCPSPPREAVTTSPGNLLSSHCNYPHPSNGYDHIVNGSHPTSSASSSVHYPVRNVYHPYNYGSNYMTGSSDVILPFLPIVSDSSTSRINSDQELSNDVSVCEEKPQLLNGQVIKGEDEGINSVLGVNSSNRPQQTKSPFEWMNKPSYQTQQQPGKTRTRDKYRVVYSDHQRLELEKEFHSSHYITIKRKSELAFSLQLSERQVKIWFQNRRAKERKQLKKKEESLSKRDSW